jgi:hypothetical protein
MKYNWDLWMDGKVHEAVEGVDFTCKRKSFVTTLRHQAFYEGTNVSIQNQQGRPIKFRFGEDPSFEHDPVEPGRTPGTQPQPERKWRWHKGEKVYEDA